LAAFIAGAIPRCPGTKMSPGCPNCENNSGLYRVMEGTLYPEEVVKVCPDHFPRCKCLLKNFFHSEDCPEFWPGGLKR